MTVDCAFGTAAKAASLGVVYSVFNASDNSISTLAHYYVMLSCSGLRRGIEKLNEPSHPSVAYA